MKLPRGAGECGCLSNERKVTVFGNLWRARLVVTFPQFRLEVEHVQLRRRSNHVQVDDVFRAWSMVRH